MANKVNILLVHGAWGEGMHWNKVIPLLAAEGHNVVAVQCPLTSLADDAETVRRAASQLEGKSLLAGHSYGGAIITEAAGKIPGTAGLVYIAAFAPDETENLAGLLQKGQPAPGGANIYPDEFGFLWIKRDKFRESFCQDATAEEALVMASAQRPIAGRCFEDKPTNTGWKHFPVWYQVSSEDRMIPPDAQRFMADRMKAETITLDASHASLATRPVEIAGFISKAAQAI
ncbi:alpha/beta hydrolase [Chitinophaga sp. G-6-1-13]|uniref:Alpha/beta hydrolase n=1 Tax=Chitinophaga fulva TaxID=2728842 RepID=A0A848GMN2_9BACT|nr:alpha/beta hydrolase [Chitinophaga fulva]NML39664.1 alpha/beta hydrolase [Chitinophaga fulva]